MSLLPEKKEEMMSLTMTGAEYQEAYPNGMDDLDHQIWDLAVERACTHDDAPAAAEATGRDSIYCPTCGESVCIPELIEGWEIDAEMRAEQAVGA